jgi:hypothetical protein
VKDDLEKYLAFERHVVGREDLLRLFRVVAAEVGHTLGPVPEVQASRPTEREQPASVASAVVVPESGVMPDDATALGVSPTVPSMKMPAVAPLDSATLPPDNGDLVLMAGELAARAPTPPPHKTDPDLRSLTVLKGAIGVVTLLLIAVLGAVVFRSQRDASAVDAGVALVDANEVPEKFVFPEASGDAGADDDGEVDAGAGAALAALVDAGAGSPRDAGLAVASPFVDAGVVAPVLKGTLVVTCDPPADVLYDKNPAGRTPFELREIPAGTHTLVFSNRQEHFGKVVTVRVEAGVRKPLAVVGQRGTLDLELVGSTTTAMTKIDGAEVGLVFGAKSFDLYEGVHKVELVLADGSKKREVTVKGDQHVKLRVDLGEK